MQRSRILCECFLIKVVLEGLEGIDNYEDVRDSLIGTFQSLSCRLHHQRVSQCPEICAFKLAFKQASKILDSALWLELKVVGNPKNPLTSFVAVTDYFHWQLQIPMPTARALTIAMAKWCTTNVFEGCGLSRKPSDSFIGMVEALCQLQQESFESFLRLFIITLRVQSLSFLSRVFSAPGHLG